VNTITCTNCGQQIEIDKALEGQIEARVLAAEHQKYEAELARVKLESEAAAKKAADAAAERAVKAAEADLDIARRRLEADMAASQKRAQAESELVLRSLREDAAAEKEQNARLRGQLGELMKSLREEKDARANAELAAQKRVAAEVDRAREEAAKGVEDKYHLKLAEQEKKLADTQKALEDAQRKATQGSQQNQGEVLELDLEARLREEFPYDNIGEVKKGQRGADIIQTVRNTTAADCGVLLWETKNGKWQPAWVPKFKGDIREAAANIGVIVSQELPPEYGDMKHLEANVWAVKPRLAPMLASALRTTILQVDMANKMSAGKDAKMEALYQFLVGPEFRHRVEAIVENYGMLQAEIEKEKRAAALRWAHQEKSIRAVIDNTIGMYGDLQGITNRALPGIKALEPGADTEEVEQLQII
jgi:hypothetical protein